MPQFDTKSAGRISKTVQREERRLRNLPSRRARYTDKHPQLLKFELLQALDKFSGDVVQAARKTWSPSADSGAGGYTVDCDDIVLVADFNETGWEAGVGGFGAAEMHAREDGTLVGTIIDLCCPGDERGVCP